MAIRMSLTPAMREARRRNAQKSTGPRTAEGKQRSAQNARRGAFPRLWRSSDPALILAYPAKKLAHSLAQAFQPADAAECLLVEELARLHARKRANQEAQTGLVLKNWQKLARDRAEHQRAMTLESSDYPACLAVTAGYLTMEDSPAKFRQLSRLLNVVKDDVRMGNFSRDVAELLKALYGPVPSMRGAEILGSYATLLESGQKLPPIFSGEGPVPEAVSADSSPAPAVEEGEEARAARRERDSLESTRAELVREIDEEKTLLASRYQAYVDEHIPSPDAMHRAALVPADDAWRALLQQDQVLDRQIENKTRLLLFMQWARRSRKRRGKTLYKGPYKASKS